MIKIIIFFLFIAFNENSVIAAPLLTVDTTITRGSMEIDLREANSVLVGSSLDKANEIFNFFEQKIYPQIPETILAKISKRAIKIEFQKDLKKGALFIDTSDESKPLILRIRSMMVNDPKFYHLLAHEWFHALHFMVHRDEPAWVREGLAQVFEFMIFGVYNQNMGKALETSTTPLNYAFNIEEQNLEAYGHVYFYFYYLFEKCGKQTTFWKLVESSAGKFAEQTVDFVLSHYDATSDFCSNFKSSLIHAELARFHNRKVKDSGGTSTFEYMITPTVGNSLKTVLGAVDVATVIPSLPKYEPKIFNAGALKSLKKMIQTNDWIVYSLRQSTPYTVKDGLSVNPNASPPDLVFVMKIQ